MNEVLMVAKQAIDGLRYSVEGNAIIGRGECFIELETTNDKVAISYGLFKDKDIAVARTIMADGASLERHHHKELEMIQVVSGELHLDIEEDDYNEAEHIILHPRDVHVIEPDIVHSATVVGKTTFIITTMPASKSFPDARNEMD